MKLDLTGQRFGKLVAKSLSSSNSHGQSMWTCLCDCGNTTVVMIGNLRSGAIKSCGCLKREMMTTKSTTHGLSKTLEYSVWNRMIQRCTNPNAAGYEYYGGRGISVCDRWMNSFELFLADMGHRPSDDQTIDRYPNQDGNYEPGNCRWATWTEQASNRRDTKIYKYQGKFYTASELASYCGITNLHAFEQRLAAGWDVEKAITQPIISKPRS